MSRIKKIVVVIAIGLITSVTTGSIALYLWPLQDPSLITASGQKLSYAEVKTAFTETHQQEKADQNLKSACHSKLYDHGQKTDKAILMLHGYTACPDQFNSLAETFFNLGYNVYIPLTPYHGQFEAGVHSNVTAKDLVHYTDSAVAMTAGLGNEVGVIGLSGGGVLATWAAEYRNDVITRLLVLAPFYQPNTNKAPVWQLKPFTVLYGFKILPDRFTKPNKEGFSYHALAQYMRVVENYKDEKMLNQLNLHSVAVAVSPHDPEIDLSKAATIPAHLAQHSHAPFQTYTIPDEWQLGHDIVSPEGEDIKGRSSELYKTYVTLYEMKSDH